MTGVDDSARSGFSKIRPQKHSARRTGERERVPEASGVGTLQQHVDECKTKGYAVQRKMMRHADMRTTMMVNKRNEFSR